MRVNLFGEIYVEPIDIAKQIVESFNNQYGIKFQPNTSKVTGFDYWNNSRFPMTSTPTIYCIYKDGEPQYVGKTETNDGLRMRVGRFCCELQGKTARAGNHPGAKKYKHFHKEDYSNLTVKYYEITNQILNIPDNPITLSQIETEVIRLINPLFNQEIYKKAWIAQAVLEIE